VRAAIRLPRVGSREPSPPPAGPLLREHFRERRRVRVEAGWATVGVTTIRLASGRIRRAELHCYEAHGIGRKELKRKRNLS